MEIKLNKEQQKLTVSLIGRLDTNTSPKLEGTLNASLNDVTELVFDFKDLEYVSSAGLRIVLSAYKTMQNKGSFTITNVSSDIMSLFEITGFDTFLNIK